VDFSAPRKGLLVIWAYADRFQADSLFLSELQHPLDRSRKKAFSLDRGFQRDGSGAFRKGATLMPSRFALRDASQPRVEYFPIVQEAQDTLPRDIAVIERAEPLLRDLTNSPDPLRYGAQQHLIQHLDSHTLSWVSVWIVLPALYVLKRLGDRVLDEVGKRLGQIARELLPPRTHTVKDTSQATFVIEVPVVNTSAPSVNATLQVGIQIPDPSPVQQVSLFRLLNAIDALLAHESWAYLAVYRGHEHILRFDPSDQSLRLMRQLNDHWTEVARVTADAQIVSES
jgi:hypothetical protein